MTAAPRVPGKTVIFDLGNVLIECNVEAILDSPGLDTHLRTRAHDELFGHNNWLELDHGSITEADAIAEIRARSELTSDLIDAARQLGIDAYRFRRDADCYARLRQLLFD